MRLCRLALLVPVLAVASLSFAADLHVGPGQPFARIEEAYAKAQSGDVILVHEQPAGKAYEKVALQVRKPKLTFKAVPAADGARVKLSGDGFNYSGAGAVPRAIFQFDPGADGCLLEGFELSGARNDSFNGAGVRINQANHVTVRNCEIHRNDMGIMSNGDASAATPTGADQLIEGCLVHSNGSDKQPGYNHNFYLGGTSVRLVACEVHSSTTGHNVKSRAHFTWVECCYIHDSANREFDLVDEKNNTAIPNSDAVLLGNVIVKKKGMNGNKTTIHFGQDGGNDHDGTIWLVHNTIVTPYISPVVELSAAGAKTNLINNVIYSDGNQQGQVLVAAAGKADKAKLMENGFISHAYVSRAFANSLAAIRTEGADTVQVGKAGERLPFANPATADFRLTGEVLVVKGQPWDTIKLPQFPGAAEPPVLRQYKSSLQTMPREDGKAPMLGAFAAP